MVGEADIQPVDVLVRDHDERLLAGFDVDQVDDHVGDGRPQDHGREHRVELGFVEDRRILGVGELVDDRGVEGDRIEGGDLEQLERVEDLVQFVLDDVVRAADGLLDLRLGVAVQFGDDDHPALEGDEQVGDGRVQNGRFQQQIDVFEDGSDVREIGIGEIEVERVDALENGAQFGRRKHVRAVDRVVDQDGVAVDVEGRDHDDRVFGCGHVDQDLGDRRAQDQGGEERIELVVGEFAGYVALQVREQVGGELEVLEAVDVEEQDGGEDAPDFGGRDDFDGGAVDEHVGQGRSGHDERFDLHRVHVVSDRGGEDLRGEQGVEVLAGDREDLADVDERFLADEVALVAGEPFGREPKGSRDRHELGLHDIAVLVADGVRDDQLELARIEGGELGGERGDEHLRVEDGVDRVVGEEGDVIEAEVVEVDARGYLDDGVERKQDVPQFAGGDQVAVVVVFVVPDEPVGDDDEVGESFDLQSAGKDVDDRGRE